jgi:hypothetical protein
MATAIRDPDMLESESCDYAPNGDAESRCGDSPAGWVGDLYYACDDHVDEVADWIEEEPVE